MRSWLSIITGVALVATQNMGGVSAYDEHVTGKPTAVLIGGTGNLAGKYLWQIMFDMYLEGKVGTVIGCATKKSEVGKPAIDGLIEAKVKCSTHGPGCETKLVEFKQHVLYRQVRSEDNYKHLGQDIEDIHAGEWRACECIAW
jgi:glucose-6-phosphate 1-dehydrogenase